MYRETPDKYAVLLAAGNLELNVGDSWLPVHEALRTAVINAALAGEHAEAVRKAVRQRRRIKFQDDEHDFIMRWSPNGVSQMDYYLTMLWGENWPLTVAVIFAMAVLSQLWKLYRKRR